MFVCTLHMYYRCTLNLSVPRSFTDFRIICDRNVYSRPIDLTDSSSRLWRGWYRYWPRNVIRHIHTFKQCSSRGSSSLLASLFPVHGCQTTCPMSTTWAKYCSEARNQVSPTVGISISIGSVHFGIVCRPLLHSPFWTPKWRLSLISTIKVSRTKTTCIIIGILSFLVTLFCRLLSPGSL